MSEALHHRLRERVKELAAVHRTARLLQDTKRPMAAVMADVVAVLPAAWQYPDETEGEITLGDERWRTPGWTDSPYRQHEEFRLRDGTAGSLTVAYRGEHSPADEGPFLREERELIGSLAEMLRAFCQHHQDDAAIRQANERLERQVLDRTAALRRLAGELCLAEERERRAIALNLHDHLGQALAFVRARLRQLQGDAVFGGHDGAVDELLDLTDQAIRYTRDLTFELSPPILYELGLGQALEWLGEQFAAKHGFEVRVRSRVRVPLPDDVRVILFKSARELLTNAAKYADASQVEIRMEVRGNEVELSVADDGRGCDLASLRPGAPGRGFGLFSIEERLGQLGGRVVIDTAPESGMRVSLFARVGEDKAT